MEIQQVKEMTNDHGKKWLDMWFNDKEILGVEVGGDNKSRKEFTIIYNSVTRNWRTGEIVNEEVCTAVLPNKETNNNGCCFFGNLQHFAMNYAAGLSGVRLRMSNNGRLIWPVWYTEKDDFLRWKKYYDEMMQKYS
jgi:hypothetical protein